MSQMDVKKDNQVNTSCIHFGMTSIIMILGIFLSSCSVNLTPVPEAQYWRIASCASVAFCRQDQRCLVSFATAITVQVFLRIVLAILPLETTDTFSHKILSCA